MSTTREAQHTNSELSGLDAGELREHGARWIAEHGWDMYADAVVLRIYGHTGPGVTLREIIGDLEGDVEAIAAGGAYGEPIS